MEKLEKKQKIISLGLGKFTLLRIEFGTKETDVCGLPQN